MKRALAVLAFLVSSGCAPDLPSDLPGLMDSMGSYDMHVSWHAAAKVRRLYGQEGLLQALLHTNAHTRAEAAHTLMHYAGPEVQRALVVAASDPAPHVRMWAAWSLGEQGTGEALPTLERLSRDPAEFVRLYAGEAAEKVKRRSLASEATGK